MGIFKCITVSIFLQALWTSSVQGYALSPPHPSITQAPAYNFLLQKRQDSGESVICSQWTIPGVGVPVCNPGLTCIFQSDGNNEGCFPPTATEVAFTTNCYDYPDTWDGSGTTPINDIYCPSSAPVCGEYVFTNTGGAWTNLGCSSTAYSFTAYQIAAFTDSPLPTAAVTTVVITDTPTVSVVSSTTSTTTPSSSSSTPTSTPTSMATSTTPSPVSSSASSTTGTPAQPSNTGESKVSEAATIGGAVGGTVGGLGALIGGIATWYYLRKKHALRAQQAAAQRGMSKEEGSFEMHSPGIGSPHC
ncbi:Mucin-12 [Xylographa soralifera]|nr:Mucin-12 [Xylographa soralifera]